ncbi:hypothetical protein PMAYCL1PPCAC_09815, partial [Pristionchus mayeri]
SLFSFFPSLLSKRAMPRESTERVVAACLMAAYRSSREAALIAGRSPSPDSSRSSAISWAFLIERMRCGQSRSIFSLFTSTTGISSSETPAAGIRIAE